MDTDSNPLGVVVFFPYIFGGVRGGNKNVCICMRGRGFSDLDLRGVLQEGGGGPRHYGLLMQKSSSFLTTHRIQ